MVFCVLTRSKTVKASPDELLARIRYLYKTSKPVKMEELSGNPRFNVKCTVDGELRGYAFRDVFVLRFFDVAGEGEKKREESHESPARSITPCCAELMVVPANSFESAAPTRASRSLTSTEADYKTAPAKPKSKTEVVDVRKGSVTEKKKFSFSFSKKDRSPSVSEASSSPVVKLEALTQARLKSTTTDKPHGPFPKDHLRLWWKYHLVSKEEKVGWDGTLSFSHHIDFAFDADLSRGRRLVANARPPAFPGERKSADG